MRFTGLSAALAATFVAAPALAAPLSDTTNATARGTVLQSHSLVNATPLDFGIVTVDTATAGTVSVSASASPVRTSTGGVTLLPSSFSAARFDGLAAPTEPVTLLVTPPTGGYITDAANDTIAVTSMFVDQGNSLNRQANGGGNFTVYVGANFALNAGQASGVYTGTFQLTATYQ